MQGGRSRLTRITSARRASARLIRDIMALRLGDGPVETIPALFGLAIVVMGPLIFGFGIWNLREDANGVGVSNLAIMIGWTLIASAFIAVSAIPAAALRLRPAPIPEFMAALTAASWILVPVIHPGNGGALAVALYAAMFVPLPATAAALLVARPLTAAIRYLTQHPEVRQYVLVVSFGPSLTWWTTIGLSRLSHGSLYAQLPIRPAATITVLVALFVFVTTLAVVAAHGIPSLGALARVALIVVPLVGVTTALATTSFGDTYMAILMIGTAVITPAAGLGEHFARHRATP